MGNDDVEPAELAARTPAPAEIELRINGKAHQLSYERAFVLACSLMEKGGFADASKIFLRLEEFADRGPRAFILHAFCECASRQFDDSQLLLEMAFPGSDDDTATILQDAFVSCHVGIRQDGVKAIAELVDKQPQLPSLCLLLGILLEKGENHKLAKRCWTLAIRRDRPDGAVAAEATRRLKQLPTDDSGDA